MRFEPKLVAVLREGYSARRFLSDLGAGVTVGVVALPLAIAFAIASGVKPEQGLVTAIVAGFLIAVLGGSRAQVSGPTGAFIVVLYGIVQRHGYEGLAVATLIAGGLLIAMGLSGMGALLKFIPYPVTVGFTSGIAVIIFSGQIRDFFGLAMPALPAGFIEKWAAYRAAAPTINPAALTLGAGTALIILLWPRLTHRIPSPLVALVAATAAARLLDLPVETIGGRFGGVPNRIPMPHLPEVSWELFRQMFPSGVTIALLAAVEALLAAVVADGMMGTRHRSDMELFAQGAGNIASVLFGGIPATGAIARTATNIKSGGRTPFAAMIHAGVLLLILIFVGQYAAWIPLCALAATLIVVSYHMCEWRAFVGLFRYPKSDIAVLLVTFVLTVLIDLTVAIQVGVMLAAFLFLQRMSEETQVSLITENLGDREESETRNLSGIEIPAGVDVFEIYGSLFFGAIERFRDAMRRVEKRPRVMILRMRNVMSVDAAGLRMLEELHSDTRRHHQALILSAPAPQPLAAMRQAGLIDRLGVENVTPDLHAALRRAGEILESVRPSH